MQKGTVCGADRSVYKLNIFSWISFCVFVLYVFLMCHMCQKAWLEYLPQMFPSLIKVWTAALTCNGHFKIKASFFPTCY